MNRRLFLLSPLFGPALLKGAGALIYSEKEYDRCQRDALYFIEKYLLNTNEKLTEFQLGCVADYMVNNHVHEAEVRASGKSFILERVLIHCLMFNPNESVVLVSPSYQMSRELKKRIKNLVSTLPKQFVTPDWETRLIVANSGDAVRGRSNIRFVFVDELGPKTAEVLHAVPPGTKTFILFSLVYA